MERLDPIACAGSLRASAGLPILQVQEQFLRFGIVGSEFERALRFSSREIRFFLLQVNSREKRPDNRGISCLKRRLQLLDGVIQFATTPFNFREPSVGCSTGGICAQGVAEFGLGRVDSACGKLLATATY